MADHNKPYTIGAPAMRKIMEVEGITLTAEDLALLDEIAGLPEGERVQRILAHVKKSARSKRASRARRRV